MAFMIPPVVERGFDPSGTSAVVQAVLKHPIVDDLPWLLIAAKYALLGVTVACLLRPSLLGRLGWGYYAAALVVISVGQNVANTDRYGLAWLAGDTLIELVVAGFVVIDVRQRLTRVEPHHLHRGRRWLLIPMALAWWFPYGMQGDVVRPALTWGALVNESGLTFCMVTPVVLGLMLLYADGVHAPTLAVASWAGLLFGIVNVLTWFALVPDSWWMGVLHLPLLLISGYGSWLSRRPGTRSTRRHRTATPAHAPA